MTAHIITIDDEVWLAPITLKVIDEWERWSKKTMLDIAKPQARDLAYICWRAAFYAGHISKRTHLDDFMRKVYGWDILNTDVPVSQQIEQWLKDQND